MSSDDGQITAHAALIGRAFEQSDHAVLVAAEAGGRYLAVNEAACRLLGYSRAELLELTPGDLAGTARVEPGAASLVRSDGSVIEIGWAQSSASLGNDAVVLTVTDKVQRARVIERAREARARSRALISDAEALKARARLEIGRAEGAVDDLSRLTEQERAAVSAAFELRASSCWERFEDAACELVSLHEVPLETLLFAVKRAVASAAVDADADGNPGLRDP